MTILRKIPDSGNVLSDPSDSQDLFNTIETGGGIPATAPITAVPPGLVVAAPAPVLSQDPSRTHPVFNLEFDAAALAAPASFRTTVQNAATLLAASLSVPSAYTINISVGYDENVSAGGAIGGPDDGMDVSYATVRADLIAGAWAGDNTFNALPTGTSDNGFAQVWVANAQLKAFGLLAGDNAAVDGDVSFSSTIPANLLPGVVLHELAHAMGRAPYGGTPNGTDVDIFDLFRFTSPGTILADDSLPAAAAAYFSIDGGVTKLASYGIHSDPSDFLNSTTKNGDAASTLTPEDPFDQYYDTHTIQTLTATDFKLLDALGFSPALAITGTTAGQATADRDTIKPFSNVTINDASPGQTETVTVTLSAAANGTLSNLAGGTFSAGVYTVTGTPAVVTAALDGLVFTPAAGQVPLSQSITTAFTIADTDTAGLAVTDSTTSVIATAVPGISALVRFNNTNGANPMGSLFADASGNLFGTTANGGANGAGTVFRIAKTAGVYASTPTTLVSFNGLLDDTGPAAALIADSNGDLFGTATGGGTSNNGAVFEIARTAGVYASSPATLVSFTGTDGASPYGDLIADGGGNLFGTTSTGGLGGAGTVFEISKIAGGYASTPITLVSFDSANGAYPYGGLIANAHGDLFGTTGGGGTGGKGTVFEIPRTGTGDGYANTPTTLVSFNGSNGASPFGSLVADASGDLFGTTTYGGASGAGSVFEILKTSGGYASTPTTLLAFNGTDGANPQGGLIVDANGDLFGTTANGGASGDGTEFELAKIVGGYASTPIFTSFDGTNGANPQGSLIVDASGNLFGTAANGGTGNNGTVFEVTPTGFQGSVVASVIAGTAARQTATGLTSIAPFPHVTISDANNGRTEAVTVTLSDAANGTLSNLGGGTFSAGVYSVTGTAATVTAALCR